MKRIIHSLFLSIFVFTIVIGQQKEPFLVFDNENHDFGSIKEEGGLATHKFAFTNTGSMPVIIKDVKPSCGCTTPDWTKEPVLPGNTGFVSATFNPSGRPGPFTKTITVNSNASNNPVTLRFNGTVIPKPKSQEDIYPSNFDSVRFSSNMVYFDSLFYGEVKSKTIQIWNTKKVSATISCKNLPKYMKFNVKPSSLKPNEKGVIELFYDSKEKNDWGYVTDYINFIVNNKIVPANNRVNISADIKENFSKLSPKEIEKAPKLVIPENSYEYGTIKKGDVIKHDFELRNEGKSNLLIRKVSSSCSCTVSDFKSKTIKPGESENITATFNSAGKNGETHTTITIISNDPKNSKTILFMNGKVEVSGN